MFNKKTTQQKRQTEEQYVKRDKEVKRRCKQDKRDYVEQLAQQTESACGKGDIKSLYNITRQLRCKLSNKNGVTLTKFEDQLGRWKEHFQKVLNRTPSNIPSKLRNRLNIEHRIWRHNESRNHHSSKTPGGIA